jgi:hypothetical protein
MEDKSNIVSIAYRREEQAKKSAPSSRGVGMLASYEKRIALLEAQLAKLTEALTEVAEDTNINRKHLMKLLQLLKESR